MKIFIHHIIVAWLSYVHASYTTGDNLVLEVIRNDIECCSCCYIQAVFPLNQHELSGDMMASVWSNR